MCGIVGYVGSRRVVPVIFEGLKRLEYRGYDSAGVVYLENEALVKYRCEGKLVNLESIVDDAYLSPSCIGIGHTRWATHGAPTKDNAHPHSDCSGKLAIVHNGIIENYHSLREELKAKGHTFTSETDTEVLAHLIEEYLEDDLVLAVRRALARVEGSYALGVIWTERPDILIAARNQSPLVLGVHKDDGSFMASDIPALLPYTNRVVFLEDGELAVLSEKGHTLFSIETGEERTRSEVIIDWSASMAEKAGFRHFMLKEIFEQPQAIANTVSGRVNLETGAVTLPEIGLNDEAIRKIERIFLVACGTSWHAALVAKYWIEKWAKIPVEVDIASEFRYRTLLIDENVLTVVISQSGETADTLAGMRLAKKLGSRVVTICNVVGSTMTREADGTIYTHAGPEIGVASTKAFTAQLAALFLFALFLAEKRETIALDKKKELARAVIGIGPVIEKELPLIQEQIGTLIDSFYDCRDFLFIGRGMNYPIALEGALKLKEISYIHAEGYAAGELKHGPIALIDKEMPILAIAPKDSVYSKVISNVEEIKARQGRLVLMGSKGDTQLATLTNDVIYLPEIHEEMNPILYTIPAQLLAYEIAARRGCDVDQPRNLAKSVTVE
jgi:glucosamine--fructose-6-phosphate aminotransferase (isomerizing)